MNSLNSFINGGIQKRLVTQELRDVGKELSGRTQISGDLKKLNGDFYDFMNYTLSSQY